jgi:recombination associated protein RdgC
VRYGRHTLEIDEVGEHIRQGKLPVSLAMTWDSRVSFVLTEGLTLKKLKLLDVVLDVKDNHKDVSAFDADVAITTGELMRMIPDLVEALGGRLEPQSIEPSAPADHVEGDGPDPLYDQAVTVVRQNKRASISLVQRHLRIGYNRAARLLEAMESARVVGPMESSGSRSILGSPRSTEA